MVDSELLRVVDFEQPLRQLEGLRLGQVRLCNFLVQGEAQVQGFFGQAQEPGHFLGLAELLELPLMDFALKLAKYEQAIAGRDGVRIQLPLLESGHESCLFPELSHYGHGGRLHLVDESARQGAAAYRGEFANDTQQAKRAVQASNAGDSHGHGGGVVVLHGVPWGLEIRLRHVANELLHRSPSAAFAQALESFARHSMPAVRRDFVAKVKLELPLRTVCPPTRFAAKAMRTPCTMPRLLRLELDMYNPLPPRMQQFVDRLATAVQELGAELPLDEVYDLMGRIYSFPLMELRNGRIDWHQVRWDPRGSCNPEFVSLAHNQAEALACAYAYAEDEELEPHELETADGVLRLHADRGLLATIEPVRYAQPSAKSLARMTTLLSGIRIGDERTLLSRLSQLPAWTVETQDVDSPQLLYSLRHVGWPRAGELHRKFSATHGSNASDRATRSWRAPQAEPEYDSYPMWASPQALAKTLHVELRPRTANPLKLSQCQELLAELHGFGSWNELVASFEAMAYPQVLASCVDYVPWVELPEVRAEPAFVCFRSPLHVLAWGYDLALKHRREGLPGLFVHVGWISDDILSFEIRERSRQSLVDELSRTLPRPVPLPSNDSEISVYDAWMQALANLDKKAHLWRIVSRVSLFQGFRDTHLEKAQADLSGLALPRKAAAVRFVSRHPP